MELTGALWLTTRPGIGSLVVDPAGTVSSGVRWQLSVTPRVQSLEVHLHAVPGSQTVVCKLPQISRTFARRGIAATAVADLEQTEAQTGQARASDASSTLLAEVLGGFNIDYRDVDPLLVTLRCVVEGEDVRERLQSRIVVICLPLAKHIALRFKGRGESIEDLEQVARVGLLNALRRFDPTKGTPFLSYAVPTIMGEVRRYLRDRSWSLCVPRAAKENHLRISPAVQKLTAQFGRAPTINEIANELDLDHDAVNDAVLAGYARTPESIDATHADVDDEMSIAHRLAVDDIGFELVDRYLSVKPLLGLLSERERAVLKMRFFDDMTQSQIALRLGCSQMQISRTLARTLEFLRTNASARE